MVVMPALACTKGSGKSRRPLREERASATSTCHVVSSLVFMNDRMGRAGTELEILNPVVGFVTVEMMDDFGRSQQSAKVFLHNNSMLDFVCPLRPTDVDAHIALVVDAPATLPPVVVFAEPPSEMFSGSSSFAHGFSLARGCHHRN